MLVLKYTDQYHFMKIRLSLDRVMLKENLREMTEGKSWQKEHPTARVMVLMSSHSNMDDGTIAWGRQKTKSKQYLARERFDCAVGFTASTIVSNQVFVHILPFLNALAMSVKSAVLFVFRDVKDVLQVQYIFYVVINYHVQPLGLDLLCPKCGEHLLSKNEQSGKHSHQWRFRCQKCKQQTGWLTLKDLYHTGPHESVHWYSQYPPPSNYKDMIMSAAWDTIATSV
ncbi:hypothetical protein EUX98_g8763 [Antrodiella citrinella]|uniref:Uncharacterized protein n=1 Tax=Antrodiella citrinella TaxID=2447956 RepID=A0A4S4M4I1_9APHY|nr:hypothetical protein EUX98_g8763 [Antrodiella citrinella]